MDNVNWNKLRDMAYKNACEHGFHDEEWSDEHLLCLVVCELMEAVQADRKGMTADKVAFEDIEKDESQSSGYVPKAIFIIRYEYFIKNTVEDELSDACIRLLDLGGLRRINLNSSINYTHYLNGSFTETVFNIVTNITNIDCPLEDRVYYALSQIFALADILNIDLMWFIETKMKYNETRPYKHGCKY